MKARTADRFTDRAAAEGLLDVAYTSADSPFGPLLLARTPRGLVRVGLPNQDAEELLVDLAERVSPRVLEAPAALDRARRELDLYFDGQARPTSTCRSTGGSAAASAAGSCGRSPGSPTARPAATPRWRRSAGNERAVRAAGTACGHNPIPLVVPCHRVLRSGGALGGYGGGLPMKQALLELEGVL